MNAAKILQTDYLDIIYAGRNKGYGSYELRRHYTRRALLALLLIWAAFWLLTLLPGDFLPTGFFVVLPEKKERQVALSEVIYEPNEARKDVQKLPELSGKQARSIATAVKNTVPEIVHNSVVKPALKPPATEQLNDALSGPVNHAGAPGGAELAYDAHATGGGSGIGATVGAAGVTGDGTAEAPIRDFVEQMPEFPGGYPALVAFLNKYMKYPMEAREAGIEGRVLIKFVVDADGSIALATVVRGLGGGCDKEALRVVNAMPKWKPGKQNGHAVKVYFTLPIHFTLQY